MAITNILQFNPSQVNQETDTQWAVDPQRTGGIGTGQILPSEMLNKGYYQWSTVVAALATMLVNKLGVDVLDTNFNNLVTVLGNLITTADVKPDTIPVSYAQSMVFDASKANGFSTTLFGNVTSISLTNVSPGQLLRFEIRQDSVGSRLFPWPSNVFEAATIDSTPNAVNVQLFLVCSDNTIQAAAPMTVR